MVILYEEKNNGFIGVSYNKEMKAWQMHIDCKEWSHNKFKRYLKAVDKVKQKLKSNGIDYVFGLCEGEKERKFNELFGAVTVPDHVAFDEDGKQNYVTILET